MYNVHSCINEIHTTTMMMMKERKNERERKRKKITTCLQPSFLKITIYIEF